MLTLATILCGLIGAMLLVQLLGISGYIRWFSGYPTECANDEQLPKAAVIVCVRGADPFLNDCLQRLTTLDYPSYTVHIVVDHPTDPARRLIEQWIQGHPRRSISMAFLEERSKKTYLKTSAVRQCIGNLDNTYGAAVLADADTVVYKRWLRDIVTPLTKPDVGVVTGNRWYDPNNRSWGALVRYVYNACSVAPMYFMQATWGGSLAIRRDVFEQRYFFDRMQDTSCEDHAIQDAARAANLRTEVHANVMMLNREECSLRSCFGFVRRQLIWTRLYHQNWRQVVLGAIAAYLTLAGSAVAVAVAACTGHPIAASWIGAAVLIELLASQWMLERLHSTIARRAAVTQDNPFPQVTWNTRLRLLVALPITLLLFTAAIISAALSRRVQWRGVTYEIVPPRGIRLIEYRPYVQVKAAVAGSASL